MVNRIKRFHILLVGSAVCLSLSACGPRYVPAEALGYGTGYSQGSYAGADYSQASYSQNAYSQNTYSQNAYSQGANAQGNFAQSNGQKSRYGHQTSGGLQAPCGEALAPCGFMRVVPVYPVYQYVIPTVDESVVAVSEPEPVYHPEPEVTYVPEVTYEPEPVYTPSVQHWPEADAVVQSWKPLRK